MHDLNLTAKFADARVILLQGGVIAAGAPDQVMTDTTLSAANGCAPPPDTPFIFPQAALREAKVTDRKDAGPCFLP